MISGAHTHGLRTSEGESLRLRSGEGFTLAFFRQQGWSVEGVDYSAEAIAGMNPDCQDAVHCERKANVRSLMRQK